MTRWLLTGAAGMLGRDLSGLLAADPRVSLTCATRAQADLTDPAAVRAAVAGRHLVINSAAWTNVDGAETAEAEATAINTDAVRTLAQACAEAGALLIHLSTDYVFPGNGTSPYPENAPTAPVNAYGRSKLGGELAVREILGERGYVVRTSWLYGKHGKNFVRTILRLAADRPTLKVVDDQAGQPTWTVALAAQLTELGHAALRGQAAGGVYHGTAGGQTTWFGLARQAFQLAGLDPARVEPTTSDAYPSPAVRPSYSVLGHDRWLVAGLKPQPAWEDQLAQAFASGAFEQEIR